MFPRIERQQQTAAAVAAFLDQHPVVAAVHYPGLANDPGHAIASRQQSGFGAMLSFDLAGGTREVRRFVEALSLIALAESLGRLESLIAHPATMTHLDMGADARRIAGIGDSLLRLTIGLEDEQDLLDDLDRAFKSLGGAASPPRGPLIRSAGRCGARTPEKSSATRTGTSLHAMSLGG